MKALIKSSRVIKKTNIVSGTKTSIIAKQTQLSIEKFRDLFSYGQIDIDRNFQTDSRWDHYHNAEYIESVLTSKATNPIHLADIDACYTSATDIEDKNYFQHWQNKGIKYLIIDGNNRHVAINQFINGDFAYTNATTDNIIIPIRIGNRFTDLDSESRKTFNSIELFVIKYTQATRHDLSDVFINLNKNMKLNDGESLNSYYNLAANSLRTYVDDIKMDKLIPTAGIYKLDINRRGIDYYILKTLAFYLRPYLVDKQNLKHFRDNYKAKGSYLNKGIDDVIKLHKQFLIIMMKNVILHKPPIVVATRNSKSNYRPQGTLLDLFIFWVACGNPMNILECEKLFDRYSVAFGKCNVAQHKYHINKKNNTAPFLELYGRTFDNSFIDQRWGALIKIGGLKELIDFRDKILNGNKDTFDQNIIDTTDFNNDFFYN